MQSLSKAVLFWVGLWALSGPGFGSANYVGPLTANSEVFHGTPAGQRKARQAVRRRAETPAGWSVQLEKPGAVSQRRAAASTDATPAPLQIGFGRELPAPFSQLIDLSQFSWVPVPGGQVLSGVIGSAEAQALRVAFQFYSIPATVELVFYTPGDDQAPRFKVTGAEIKTVLDSVATARDADDKSPVLYWSPVVEGAALGVEIFLPTGVNPADLRVALPQVSHIEQSIIALSYPPREDPADPHGVFSCHIDAICGAEVWGQTMNGVARMVFSDSAGTYYCSGNLLADLDPNSQIPYFLTANHCISSQQAAANLQTYWFYRRSTCGGPPIDETFTPTVLHGGAELLGTLNEADNTLLRLNAEPPRGTVMLGWDATRVATFPLQVTGIHHPMGDLQRLSQGSSDYFQSCLNSTSINCTNHAVGKFYHVVWNRGTVQQGSSGSGLFRNDTQKLIGVLSFGPSNTSCAHPNGELGYPTSYRPDNTGMLYGFQYGSFADAFTQHFYQWLGAQGSCDKAVGSWGYCADPHCGPCAHGEGDCDSDTQCKNGLVCGENLGAGFGLASAVDVCVHPTEVPAQGACRLAPGDYNYCADPACGPCGAGMGDCDSDAECQTGLTCAENRGAEHGLPANVDVCVARSTLVCTKRSGDWDFCSDPACGPCTVEGQGDCDVDADCANGMICASNRGAAFGLPSTMDVCVRPPATRCTLSVGDWAYCSTPGCGPCTEGQGDCDADRECAAGLICTYNAGEAYGLAPTLDVCKRPSSGQ